MPKKEPYTTPPRLQVVPLLTQRFVGDYNDAVKHYELPQQLELTEHLLQVLELFQHYDQDEPEATYGQLREIEEALLKKYRKTLKPYLDRMFHKYFYFETILSEKDIITPEDFNRLTSDQQGLTVNEINQFIQICYNSLYNAKIFLYLRMEPETSSKEITPIAAIEPDKDITKARQLLAIYYLLKTGFSIEHRDSHAVSAVARLAHLLTGTKLTSLQNSDIYKKYSLMPYYKKGEQLIADLQFIRPFFADLNIQDVVKLIDEEIHDIEKRSHKR